MKRRSEIGDNCIDDIFYLRDSLIWKIEYEKLKLEQRINKAIELLEYIKDENSSYYIEYTIRDLLDILKGSDKE